MLGFRGGTVNYSLVSYIRQLFWTTVLNCAEIRRMTKDIRTKSSPTFSPLYRQIKEFMISSLEAGEWGPGDAIPSEGELAVRFNVSQGTVRKAIDEMAAENLLVRRQGKGTFVATHSDPRSFYRFLRLLPDDGHAAQSVSDPLSCTVGEATPEMAQVLSLAPGDPVILVERLLRFNGEPVVFDRICLVHELFAGLTLEQLRAGERSLYSLFEGEYGVRMISAEERLRAVAADEREAGLLGVGVGEPLLLVERVAHTYGNRPVEWRRGVYCTRHHFYSNALG